MKSCADRFGRLAKVDRFASGSSAVPWEPFPPPGRIVDSFTARVRRQITDLQKHDGAVKEQYRAPNALAAVENLRGGPQPCDKTVAPLLDSACVGRSSSRLFDQAVGYFV